MDKAKRERLKQLCSYDPQADSGLRGERVLELLADLERAEQKNAENTADLAAYIAKVDDLEEALSAQAEITRQQKDKVITLRAGLIEIRRYAKTDDPNFRRAHALLEGTR